MGNIWRSYGEGLFVGFEEVLANYLVTQKIKAGPILGCVWFVCGTADWNINPSILSTFVEAYPKDLGEDVSITLAEVTMVVKSFLLLVHKGWMTFSLRC